MFEKSSKIYLPVDNQNSIEEELSFNFGNLGSDWHEEEEGQLSVDVAQTKDELIVVATMAGTDPEKMELHIHNDLLTIRGFRKSPVPFEAEYLVNESYWGKFSRTIVLPVDVKPELARAEYKSGVLTVHLPKASGDNNIPIFVVEE